MLTIKNLPFLRQNIRYLRRDGKRIALVPTMGNLHDGHLRLVDEAKSRATAVVISIFINPMQFDHREEIDHYPRTLQEDFKKLNKYDIDFVFCPKLSDMYPEGIENITYVEIPGTSSILGGAKKRKEHYRGVSTIITKLFNLIQPDIACFGEKDFQQLMLIRKIVADLNYDIEIVSVPIVRERDGLALSSRNSYLNASQREIAPNLRKVMNEMAIQLCSKKITIEKIISIAKRTLIESGFRPDDLEIRDAVTLMELTEVSRYAIILVAAWLGKARLIDNKVVDLSHG